MAETIIDSKGRIVIPEAIRREAGLRRGSRVKVTVQHGAIVITKGVESKTFIREMEGQGLH